jgi:uncharacterized protein (DUF2141 family)
MFKKLPLVIIIIFAAMKSKSQGKIVVNISNIKNDNGVCRTCLFNNAASFKGETGQPFQCTAIKVKDKIAAGTFENIPAGNYAIMVFHDENNNSKLDKNFLGIPKEGYGASKNKLPFAGAPTFADNAFTVKDKATNTVAIKLRNL